MVIGFRPGGTDGYETLLRLEMWGDYVYEGDLSTIYIYHFNDFESPQALYRRFLSGEETVQIRDDAWVYGDRQKEWTLKDIRNELSDIYLTDGEYSPRVEYAYLDCGNDGVEDLAVRFVGLDIYAADDDSNVTMIIICKDKSLEVVYSSESWARSYETIHYHGCITGSGSDGAGSHSFGTSYLDGNGDLHSIYGATLSGGWWIRDLDSDIYDTVFDSSDPEAEVTDYWIDDTAYYVIHSYNTSIDSLCQEYVSLCEQKGMHFVSEDEIDELIRQSAQKLGVEYDWLFEDEVSWDYWYY